MSVASRGANAVDRLLTPRNADAWCMTIIAVMANLAHALFRLGDLLNPPPEDDA